jgi:hypothetical protein
MKLFVFLRSILKYFEHEIHMMMIITMMILIEIHEIIHITSIMTTIMKIIKLE